MITVKHGGRWGILAAMVLAAAPAAAQTQRYPFSSGQWKGVEGSSRVEQYLGRESLYLQDAAVHLEGVTFGDGTIEVDVSTPRPQAFAHVNFRALGQGEAEDVYLRLHSSGSPAAVQYAPIFKTVSAWQLQGGSSGWGRAVFDKNAWTHLRIEVEGAAARIYVNDSPQPVLTVARLRRAERLGGVALWAEVGAYYSNFTLTPRAVVPPAPASAAASPTPEPGVLTAWELSDAFAMDSVQADRLPEARAWSAARADVDGLLNISRFRAKPGNAGVVLARTTIRSDRPQTKKLYFGYSIAEEFGGWGLQARLADTSGILP